MKLKLKPKYEKMLGELKKKGFFDPKKEKEYGKMLFEVSKKYKIESSKLAYIISAWRSTKFFEEIFEVED
jgi:hypothetical protein